MRMALIFLTLSCAAMAAAHTQLISTARHRYRLERPVLVSGPQVGYACWTPNGNHLLFLSIKELTLEQVTKGRILRATVSAWSIGEKQSQPIYSFDYTQDKEGATTEFAWFPGASRCLMFVRNHSRDSTKVVFIDVMNRTAKVVGEWVDVQFARVSPVLPYGIVVRKDGSGAIVNTILSNGELTRRFEPAKGMKAGDWLSDGRLAFTRADQPTKLAFDPATQTMSAVTAGTTDYAAAPPPPGDLKLVRESTNISHGKLSHTMRPLWLVGDPKTESPGVLLSADATADGQIAAQDRAVWYLQQGALWVVQLVKINPAEFAAYQEAEKEEQRESQPVLLRFTVSSANALQVARKSSIFIEAQSADRADQPATSLIGNEASFNIKLVDAQGREIEVKNGLIVPGNGRRRYASDRVPSPYDIAGYIVTPFGTVVVYKDGHTRWEGQ